MLWIFNRSAAKNAEIIYFIFAVERTANTKVTRHRKGHNENH